MCERQGTGMIFAGETEGKEILGTPKRIWEDNNKMYFQEVG